MKSRSHTSFSELYAARHEPENLLPIAEAFWRAVLILALCLVVGTIAFGFWVFSAVMGRITAASASGAAPQTATLDRAQLDQAIIDYGERRAEYEFAAKAPPQVADPSRP